MIDATELKSVVSKHRSTKKLTEINFKQYELDIASLVRRNTGRFNPSSRNPIGDVAWDCFSTLFNRRFFEKFDETKSSKWSYFNTGVTRYLIDRERADGKRLVAGVNSNDEVIKISLISTTHAETGDNILDSYNVRQEKEDLFSNMLSMSECLKEVPCFTYKDVEGYDLMFGAISLNPYNVVRLYLLGYTYDKIGLIFGEPADLISELFMESVDLLKEQAAEGQITIDQFTDDSIDNCTELENELGSEDLELDICICREDEYREVGRRILHSSSDIEIPVKECIKCGERRTEISRTILENYPDKRLLIKAANRIIRVSKQTPLCDLLPDVQQRRDMKKLVNSYFKGNNMAMQEVNRWAYLYGIKL